MLIATGCNEVIKLHQWPSCEHSKTFELPYSGYSVSSISWCIDSELLAYSTSSQTPPIIFSSKEVDEDDPIEIRVPQVGVVCFSATKRTTIALGTETGHVMLYDIENRKILRNLPILPSAVHFLNYGGKDTILAAGCTNGLICVYNPQHNIKSTFYIPETDRPISSMTCHSELANVLAGASVDGIVAVWDTNTGNCMFKHKMHIGAVNGLAFSVQNDLATVGSDCGFKCYDVRHKVHIFSVKADCKLTDVDFMSSDGGYIAVSTIDGKIYCYDRRQVSHPLNTIIAHHPKPISKIAFQPFLPENNDNSFIDLSYTPASTRLNSGDFDMQHFYAKNVNTAPYAIVGQDCLYKPPDEEFDDISESNSFFINDNVPRSGSPLSPVETCNSDISRGSKGTTQMEMNLLYGKPPVINLPHKDNIVSMTSELKIFTEELINKLTEYVDEEFLKIRLVVGKGFVDLETQISSKWEGLDSHIFRFAGGDTATEVGSISDAAEEDNNHSDKRSTYPKSN